MRYWNQNRSVLSVAVAGIIAGIFIPQAGAQVPVFGGPAFDQVSFTGYRDAYYYINVNVNGIAIGNPEKLRAGIQAVRWDAAGNAGELSSLGLSESYVASINASNIAIGYSYKYVSGISKGFRAARWDSSGNVIELGNLGTDASGVTSCRAVDLNENNVAIGYAEKYVSGISKGYRGVRWDAAGNAIELGDIGTDSTGFTVCYPSALNSSNIAIGSARKYISGNFQNWHAVRWDAAGNAQELGFLNNYAYGQSSVYAINDSNFAVGVADRYVSNMFQGTSAVRWDDAGNVLELENFGGNSSAGDINASNIAVGSASNRAVRWDAAGKRFVLGNLGTGASDNPKSYASAINDSNVVAGSAEKYVGGVNLGYRAVVWGADAVAIDLNTLISATSGWTLVRALDISNNGWVAGAGNFDPDGTGPLIAYQRLFSLNINSSYNWTNSAGGNWNTGTNWFTNFAPGVASDASFNASALYSVNIDTAATAKNLNVSAGNVTLAVGANTVQLVNDLNVSGGSLTTTGKIKIGSPASSEIGVGGNINLNNGTLKTGSIDLGGDPSRLNWTSGTLQITGAVGLTIGATGPIGSSLSLSPSKVLKVDQTLSVTGTLIATNGASINAGNISVSNTGTLTSGNVRTGNLILTSGALVTIPLNGSATGVSLITGLSIDGTSKLELYDNDLIINYGANPSAYASVLSNVKSGLTILGGAGTDGITSSEVDHQTIGGTVLAVVDDGDPNVAGGITSLSGFVIPNPMTSVLVKYTWFGDANLDGVVDGSDYALTDTGFTSGGSLKGWVFGDMNFDGVVAGDDYALVDTGFIAQTGALPEPATLGLLGMGAMGLMRRRRAKCLFC